MLHLVENAKQVHIKWSYFTRNIKSLFANPLIFGIAEPETKGSIIFPYLCTGLKIRTSA